MASKRQPRASRGVVKNQQPTSMILRRVSRNENPFINALGGLIPGLAGVQLMGSAVNASAPDLSDLGDTLKSGLIAVGFAVFGIVLVVISVNKAIK